MPQITNNIIPPKTRDIVAAEFGITVKVLNAIIQRYELDILQYGMLFPKQQKLIYETLGYPNCVDREDYKNV
jgi:hypothetical protein